MAVSPINPFRLVARSTARLDDLRPRPASSPGPIGFFDGFVAGVKNAQARVIAVREAYDVGQLSGYGAGLRGEALPELPPTGDAMLDTARTSGLEAGFARGNERRELIASTQVAGFDEARAAANAGGPRPGASETDPELLAAHQAGLDTGYEQGLEDQRAICFEEGRKAGRGEQPEQLQPDDLSTPLGQVQWSGYTLGVLAGKKEVLPLGAEEAIGYAIDPPTNPANPDGIGKGWAYWCLGMVRRAYEGAGNAEATARLRQPSAQAAYDVYAGEGRIQTEGVPPRGAVVFFAWGEDGHVGISLGDGTYVGTEVDGSTGIRPTSQGGSSYLGWAQP